MNECTTCGEDFGSVSAFDAHRVGDFPQSGPSEYAGATGDWTPSAGRRCLTADELNAGRRFARNEHGSWSLADDLRRVRERFAAAAV